MIGTISIEDVVKGVVVNGENVVDYDGIAKIIIPDPPEVPVKDVKVDGESVVDPQGDANIVIPVKDVKVDGESVIDSEGVANITIPDPPEAPVKDVKVDGESVVNAQGVANITIPDPPEAPVKDVKVDGESVVNAQGVANIVVPVISNLRVVKQLPGVPAAVVTVSDAEAFTMPSLKVAIEPQQDLHGYDSPWAGGAGKNKFNIEGWLNSSGATYTKSGNTYTITATNALFNTPFTFSDTDVAISASASSYVAGTATNIRIQLLDSNNNVVDDLTANQSYQKSEGVVASKVRFNWSTSGTFTITEPQIEIGSTATSFAPYSNICPISGWDEANITVADDDTDPTISNVYTIDLDGTRYGGTLDVVSGVLTLTHGYIASYNGETLPSTWISDRDVYEEGTTPTIGAEVCYELATPLTIQLNPTAVKSLVGDNNIFADSGKVVQGEYVSNIKVINIG